MPDTWFVFRARVWFSFKKGWLGATRGRINSFSVAFRIFSVAAAAVAVAVSVTAATSWPVPRERHTSLDTQSYVQCYIRKVLDIYDVCLFVCVAPVAARRFGISLGNAKSVLATTHTHQAAGHLLLGYELLFLFLAKAAALVEHFLFFARSQTRSTESLANGCCGPYCGAVVLYCCGAPLFSFPLLLLLWVSVFTLKLTLITLGTGKAVAALTILSCPCSRWTNLAFAAAAAAA